MLLVMFAHVGKEIVITHVKRAAFIKEVEDTLVQSVKKVYDLGVVCECQLGNDALEAFLLESVLLMDEHLLKVNLMDLFIGIVDAELFKTVVFEHLEAIDVQKFHLPYFLFS